jgi:hypothetical protein
MKTKQPERECPLCGGELVDWHGHVCPGKQTKQPERESYEDVSFLLGFLFGFASCMFISYLIITY